MKINTISRFLVLGTKINNPDYKKAKKPLFLNSAIYGLKQDTLSFSSKKESLYDDFMQKAKVAYPDVPIEKICEDILVDKGKIIGSGAFKDVYSIPKLDDYLLGCKRDEYHSRHAFEKSKMPFEKYYFGDPIATNNADLIIMKKVRGESHSLPDWCYAINDIGYERRELREDEAKLFLQKITDLADFELSSYVNFAKKLKYLNKKGVIIDFVNPNNFLIDKESKTINIIDIPYDMQFLYEDVVYPENGLMTMILPLTDFLMQKYYFDILDEKDSQKIYEATNKVIEKCAKACSIVDLGDDSQVISNTLDFMDEQSPLFDCSARYEEFLERYPQLA